MIRKNSHIVVSIGLIVFFLSCSPKYGNPKFPSIDETEETLEFSRLLDDHRRNYARNWTEGNFDEALNVFKNGHPATLELIKKKFPSLDVDNIGPGNDVLIFDTFLEGPWVGIMSMGDIVVEYYWPYPRIVLEASDIIIKKRSEESDLQYESQYVDLIENWSNIEYFEQKTGNVLHWKNCFATLIRMDEKGNLIFESRFFEQDREFGFTNF